MREHTTEGGDYQAILRFTSPPAAVVEALTTADGVTSWWSATTGDGSVGGTLRIVFDDDIPVLMRVDTARDDLVQWTCLGYAPLPDWAGTTITYALTPLPDGGCELAFRHRGLTPKLECYADCKSGWEHFLPSLRKHVDTGEGTPWASAADVARRETRQRRQPAPAH